MAKTSKIEDLTVEYCVGDNALTPARAKELLGWEELENKTKACVPELLDLYSAHVVLKKDNKNRFLTKKWLAYLRQEHLNRRWKYNGETIKISQAGMVVDGQHRLISLILAGQKWDSKKQGGYWKELWPDGPPTMPTLLVMGVSEDDETFRTLNQGKLGTFTETIYRSKWFANKATVERKLCSKYLDIAARTLWARTRDRKLSGEDAYVPIRTNSELMDCIANHPRLVEAVNEIIKIEGKSDLISNYFVGGGSAAALLYLMAASKTDIDEYRKKGRWEGTTKKPIVNFDNWDKAVEFWEQVAAGDGLHRTLLTVTRMDAAPTPSYTGDNFDFPMFRVDGVKPSGADWGHSDERKAVLCKAWNLFISGEEITADLLRLHYHETRTDDDELVQADLDEVTDVGGIDVSDFHPKSHKETDDLEYELKEGEGGEEDNEDEELAKFAGDDDQSDFDLEGEEKFDPDGNGVNGHPTQEEEGEEEVEEKPAKGKKRKASSKK